MFFAALDEDCVLYGNLGNWKSEDVTGRAGAACRGLDCMEAAFADTYGDGREDVFLSQIFFALDVETGRCDAGRGQTVAVV